jgi:rhamnulokinase
VEVIATATHDTASAVAATPLTEGSAYISSGTWSLIGVERDSPLITRDIAQLNFTNEGGVYGTFRLLKMSWASGSLNLAERNGRVPETRSSTKA